MRQGPDYFQYFEYDDDGRPIITVPIELVSDFENCDYVSFHDNGNGTYQLRIFDKLN